MTNACCGGHMHSAAGSLHECQGLGATAYPGQIRPLANRDPSPNPTPLSKLPQFWREHNPEAVAVAEATGMDPSEPATAFVCQVRALL